MKKDYYEILGLSKTSSIKEIKNAFRKLALIWHPDKNNSLEAKERFSEIYEAYIILNDTEKRKIYNDYGHDGLNQYGTNSKEENRLFKNIEKFFGEKNFEHFCTMFKHGENEEDELTHNYNSFSAFIHDFLQDSDDDDEFNHEQFKEMHQKTNQQHSIIDSYLKLSSKCKPDIIAEDTYIKNIRSQNKDFLNLSQYDSHYKNQYVSNESFSQNIQNNTNKNYGFNIKCSSIFQDDSISKRHANISVKDYYTKNITSTNSSHASQKIQVNNSILGAMYNHGPNEFSINNSNNSYYFQPQTRLNNVNSNWYDQSSQIHSNKPYVPNTTAFPIHLIELQKLIQLGNLSQTGYYVNAPYDKVPLITPRSCGLDSKIMKDLYSVTNIHVIHSSKKIRKIERPLIDPFIKIKTSFKNTK